MPRQRLIKFWQTREFKNLQKTWDEKLAESGFEDLEINGRLKQNAGNSYRTKNLAVIENKQRYYEIMGQRFNTENFNDPFDEYVIERRVNGISITQISKELSLIKTKKRKEKRKKNEWRKGKSSKETIRKIIRHYEKKWNIAKKRA